MSAEGTTIVLIHGLWVTPLIWEPFLRFYGNLGYHVLAPAWPGIEGSIADLRRDASGLSDIEVSDVVAHYAKVIRRVSPPSVIIGHGCGGLIAQLLCDRGLGAAVVAIGSLPPRGLLIRSLRTRLALLPALAFASRRDGTCLLTFQQFWRRFCHTLPESDARKAYETQVIPAPGRSLVQAVLANVIPGAATTVDFKNARRPPLLVIGGGEDRVVPPALNRAIVRRHGASPCRTAYMEFPGRSHHLIAEPGWQEVADYALTWALAQVRLRR